MGSLDIQKKAKETFMAKFESLLEEWKKGNSTENQNLKLNDAAKALTQANELSGNLTINSSIKNLMNLINKNIEFEWNELSNKKRVDIITLKKIIKRN